MSDISATVTSQPISATVYSTITGNAVATFTTTIPDAAAGKINVALTDTQTTTIGGGTFAWQLVWTVGTVTRTAMAGFIDATI